MSGVQIPDAAWRAAGEAVDEVEVEHGVRVKGRGAIAPIVNAAAPHIVAAELRRLADEADQMRLASVHAWQAAEDDSWAKKVAYARLGEHADYRDRLNARADELDGAR